RWRIVSPGHESVGVSVAENFLNRIHAPAAIHDRVLPLVANHMAHYQIVSDRAVRRLANRLHPENIQGLCLVMRADRGGRPPLPAIVPAGATMLLEKARELELQKSAPKPILLGRHLMELGMTPGKNFGAILNAAFEAQLEGEFFDLPQALDWLKNREQK
ncbi:MAG: CCA tRNA nucleotidyltransferase, partial [Limisphaerales bacterium]